MIWKVIAITLISFAMVLSAWPNAVLGQQTVVVIFLNVTNLHPYTAETRYMSLAGYYRTLVHTQTGVWMTYGAADRLVRQLGGH